MSDRELLERLEKVERSNRRLKQGGLALLVMLVALTTIYATRPVPNVIKAHKFEVVDSAGTVRVKITAQGGESQIELRNMYGKAGAIMEVGVGLPGITLWGPSGKSGIDMYVLADGSPALKLTDDHGFETDIGRTQTTMLKTGQTQETTAASIIMFGNDKAHHVIWKAP